MKNLDSTVRPCPPIEKLDIDQASTSNIRLHTFTDIHWAFKIITAEGKLNPDALRRLHNELETNHDDKKDNKSLEEVPLQASTGLEASPPEPFTLDDSDTDDAVLNSSALSAASSIVRFSPTVLSEDSTSPADSSAVTAPTSNKIAIRNNK